ncbi:MAG: HD domain-containing protein [Patescibacteria group bacterium]|nr:HD domain-containing protein [Patescibacteria group bacterium]
MDAKNIANFIFELAQLRRIKHEGWRLAGVEHPDSVAEHSLRAAQIGFVLAVMEGYERPDEVASIVVFHELEECRIGDVHRVANRYVTADKERAVSEQAAPLAELGERLQRLWSQMEKRDTTAGIIAKDADYLEMAYLAKEYIEKGHGEAQDWINNIGRALKTESAKRLFAELETVSFCDWWKGLKKIDARDR